MAAPIHRKKTKIYSLNQESLELVDVSIYTSDHLVKNGALCGLMQERYVINVYYIKTKPTEWYLICT